MKKRSKEEMREYMRIRRDVTPLVTPVEKVVTPGVNVTPISVTPVQNVVTPVTPCNTCLGYEKEIKKLQKKLQAKVVLLEAENRVRAKSYPSKVQEDSGDLYKRVLRDKEDRLRGLAS